MPAVNGPSLSGQSTQSTHSPQSSNGRASAANNNTDEKFGNISEEGCSDMVSHNGETVNDDEYQALLAKWGVEDGYGVSRDASGKITIDPAIIQHKQNNDI